MNIRVCCALFVLMTLVIGAQATDRGALMIDTVSINLADMDDVDSMGASLWGETAIGRPREDWSLLFGGGLDDIGVDGASNIDAWTIGIGLKYYITELTSVSGVGTYTVYDQGSGTDDKDAKAAIAGIKHRFITADEPVSPFVKGALTWRDRTTFTNYDPTLEDDTFSEFLFTLIGGAEFRMNRDWSFVVEVGYVTAEAADSHAEDLDGPIASVAMQYYWHKPSL